jgi:hypothetical protein
MAKAYVFSTLASDMNYTLYVNGGGDMPVKERAIFIKGGTGVANDRLITPQGVMTEIEEEDIPVLQSNQVFQLHEKNGFVKIEKRSADPEKVASDMNRKDNSAPLTDADYNEDDPASTIKVATKGRRNG